MPQVTADDGSPPVSEETPILCEHCERELTLETAYSVHTSMSRRHRQFLRTECGHCAWQCADCDEWFSQSVHDDAGLNADGNEVCESCHENYSYCEGCENTVHNDDYTGDMCTNCHDSHAVEEEESPTRTESEELSVLRRQYQEARRAYDLANTDATRHVYIQAERAYERAAGEEDERRRTTSWGVWPPPRVINDYQYKPSPMFYHKGECIALSTVPTDMPFYGIEVESECMGNEMGRELEKRVCTDPIWYAKRDSSIAAGAEFVSHPCSFSDWMRHDFSLFAKLRENGWRSYDTRTCGMHVHIRRMAFSQLGIVKLMRLFRVHADLFLKLSRRRDITALSTFSRINLNNDRELQELAGRKWAHSERYAAINLENRSTVEIRIFRGTLDPAGIKRNIALCHALVSFVRDNGIREMTTKGFAKWIGKHAESICGKAVGGSLKKWILDASHQIEDQGS